MVSVNSILSGVHDVKNVSQLCRFCGKLKQPAISIFDKSHLINYQEIINFHFKGIQVSKTDDLPLKVCSDCMKIVLSWHSFHNTCLRVNNALLSVVNKLNVKVVDLESECDSTESKNDVEVVEVGVECLTPNIRRSEDQKTNENVIEKLRESNIQCETGRSVFVDVNATRNVEKTVTAREKAPPPPLSTDEGPSGATKCVKCGSVFLKSKIRSENNRGTCYACYSKMNKSATATMSAIFRDYLVVDENKQSYFLCDLCDFSCEAFPDVFAHHYKTEHPKANLCQNFRNENDDPLRKFAIEKNGVTSYRCDRCQMSCISRNVFIKHYAEHGDQTLQSNTVMIEFNDDKFRCSVCKKTYVHLRAAKRHLKRVHSEKKYQCNVCQKAFTYEHKAREHEKRHLKIKPFMCDICGNRFVDKLYLQKHKDKNLCSKYTCVSCNKNFRNKASLQHHMLLCEVDRQKENCPANIPSAAKNESVPQKQNQLSKEALWMKYECAKCEKKFKSKRMLRIHIVEEFNLSPYKCFICDQRFRTTVMLKEHLNLCNKSILDGNHCEDFSFTNNGNNSFGCKLCGRTFRKIGYLRQHFRLHSSSKPYVCPLCGKSYALKASFQSHMLTETNLRKFVCSKCGKRYNSSSHLTAHIKKHHRSREFKCNACDKEFAYEGDLKKHEKTHEEIKSFFCDKCGGFFKTKRCLEVHWERCSLLKK